MAESEQTTLPLEIQEPVSKKPINHKERCQDPSCDKWAWANGYCNYHQQRLKKLGLIKKKRIFGDDLARFHTKYKVNPETGCWEWIGFIHPRGYGQFGVWTEGKTYRAHKFAYERLVGPIPDGMIVRHKCDVKICVRPDHLELGTQADNMRDCLERGRHQSQNGGTPHKVTQAMALNIRVIYARSLPWTYGNERNHYSIRDLAKVYPLDEETIRIILKGQAHLKV